MSLIFLLALPIASTSPSPECPPPLLGAWEYRQRAGDGYDAEGEILRLTCSDKVLKGFYYGLEREGEHGLFYTLVEVIDLKIVAQAGLSFTVPGRELFYERPKDPQEVAGKTLQSAGFTRDELHIQGRLNEGNLVLSCSSKASSCPENVMVFHKSP